MHNNISFTTTDGTTLRGWHYTPNASGKHPTIVMAHGFSAVKEMYLDRYAEAFAQAGFASVVYDNRNFGASDGEPRQEIDPWLQIRDYSDAITFAQSLDQTDPTRIGVWGSSYSGAHVLVVAATDRRVKCVVSQVPAISGSQGFRRLVRADFIAPLEAQLHADRVNRAAGGAPAMLPVVAADTDSAIGVADRRFLPVVYPDRCRSGTVMAQRGDVANHRIRLRLRAGRLYRSDFANPSVAHCGGEGPSRGVRSCHRRVRACLGAKTLGAVAGWALRGVRRGIRSIVRPGLRLVSRPPWMTA